MSIVVSRHEEAAVLTLDRQEALNALSFAALEQISAAIDEVARGDARALIVTGAGSRAFCAGADVMELRGRDLAAQKAGAEFGQRVFSKLDTLGIPSIAVLNGYALGGGLELALACTFRLALPNARMALPEIKLGLIPGYGGTQRLPRLIGEARALEMILTGRMVEAAEAAHIGLVNRLITGDPIAAALAFAHEFSSYSKMALRFARGAVRRALDLPLYEGLKVEADLSTLAYCTADAEEGMAAFCEKRAPNFRDS